MMDLASMTYRPESTSTSQGQQVAAFKYIHPNSHPAGIITEDEAHRFVTDTEKAQVRYHLESVFINESDSLVYGGEVI